MMIGGSGTGTTTPTPQNSVNINLNSSNFEETGSYHKNGDQLTYGWNTLLPGDYDGNLFNLTDFNPEAFMTFWDNQRQDYDYTYNIQSLDMALNTFRLNLTIL